MTDDNPDCDRCGATIILGEFERPSPLHFAVEVGEPDDDELLYEEEMRTLCDACEEDLLEWVDEGDIDRSDCADLPSANEASAILRRAANTLERQADVLDKEMKDASTD